MRAFSILIATGLFVACATQQPQATTRPWDAPREQLDKSDVVAGMGRATSNVRECYDRYKRPGTYMTKVVIGGSGIITEADASGPDADTALCVRSAVMTATFPKFSGAPMPIEYPFVLR